MTFVDSIVSGSEQKRRFVFTQNGGGEEVERERREEGGVTLAAAQILFRQNRHFYIDIYKVWLLSLHNPAVTQVDVELLECKCL